MSKFKQYEGPNTITLPLTKLENEYIKDTSGNYIYLGFTDGTTLDGYINNFDDSLTDIYETLIGVNIGSISLLCSWTIDKNDNTDNTNTAKRILVTLHNSSILLSRTLNLRYNNKLLLKIKLIIYNHHITVTFWYNERLVDSTNNVYDVQNGLSSIKLDNSIPYKLNFNISVKFKDVGDDEFNYKMCSCYFNANSKDAVINNSQDLTAIADYYYFDCISFYDNGNYKLGEKEDTEENILTEVTLFDNHIITVGSIYK